MHLAPFAAVDGFSADQALSPGRLRPPSRFWKPQRIDGEKLTAPAQRGERVQASTDARDIESRAFTGRLPS